MDKVYGFKVKSGGPCPVLDPWELIVNRHTLPGTTISHHRVVMKISFLFQSWDMLVTSRVVVVSSCLFIQVSKNKLCHGFLQEAVLILKMKQLFYKDDSTYPNKSSGVMEGSEFLTTTVRI